MTTPFDEVTRIGSAVSDVLEEVFGTVAEVRAAGLRGLERPERTVEPSCSAPFPGLEDSARALLQSQGQLAIGLGAIAAPQPDRRLPLRLQWWQIDPSSDLVLALDPDLKPSQRSACTTTPQRRGSMCRAAPVSGTSRVPTSTFTGPGGTC